MKTKLYQLSLTRTPGRFTDKEWEKELTVLKARNAEYRLSYYNFVNKNSGTK